MGRIDRRGGIAKIGQGRQGVFVIHLTLAHLQIGRPQGGVGIGGVAEQGLQVRVGLGPGVEPPDDGHPGGEIDIGGVTHPGHRIADGVHTGRKQIAQIRRSKNGEENVRPRPDAIAPQRIAKAVGMVGNAQFRRNVDGADDPDRRIHRQAKHRFERRERPDLQKIVQDHHRLFEIGGDVVDALADEAGRQAVRQESHGADDLAIEPSVDDIVLAVEMLPWIRIGPARQHGRRHDAAGQDAEQDDGQECSTHAGLLGRPVHSPRRDPDSIETCPKMVSR